jgi:DNA-binding HxlR family transcriptional regulator
VTQRTLAEPVASCNPQAYNRHVLHRTYERQHCSIARALELVGERWTILILRDAFLGIRRFDDFQRRLGVARNILQARLTRLVDDGVLERRRYQERPERFEYVLTDMGRDLWPVIVTLMQFGDEHLAPDGPPTVIEHRDCGGEVTAQLTCAACGADLGPNDVTARVGPGALPGQDRPGDPVPA